MACTLALHDFPSFSEGLSLREKEGHLMSGATDNFPSFSEGLSLRDYKCKATKTLREFPFLFGGTFIEGSSARRLYAAPSRFPFLFGGTFIEGYILFTQRGSRGVEFPFLFGGTFIEGWQITRAPAKSSNFPSFSEGLSLRALLLLLHPRHLP